MLQLLIDVFMGLFLHKGELSSLNYAELIATSVQSIFQGHAVLDSIVILLVFVVIPVVLFTLAFYAMFVRSLRPATS